MRLNDENFRDIWKYTHKEVIEWCIENIKTFKQGKKFLDIKKLITEEKKYVYCRRLDSNNNKSVGQKFYTESALKRIKDEYTKE